MITKLFLENFKCFKKQELRFSNLTLLTGVNSAGKSSIIQALLLIKQTFENAKEQVEDLFEIIKGNKIFKKINNKEIVCKVINDMIIKNAITSGKYIQIHNPKSLLYDMAETDDILLKFSIDSEELLFKIDTKEKNDEEKLSIKIKNLNVVSMSSLFSKENFSYLSANRIIPAVTYLYSPNINDKQLGNEGEYSIHYLYSNKSKDIVLKGLKEETAKTYTLLENVIKWLGKISKGIDLEPSVDENLKICSLLYSYGGRKLFPESVGFGITYSLPIILILLKANKGDIAIIENPESHLHPRAQVELARLCAKASMEGVQIIIETHSDHFLNAIRVAIKEKLISENMVSIHFFNREEKNIDITEIKVDKNGKIDKWPKGFFDEWDVQLEKLLW